MEKITKLKLLKTAFWIGAITDGLAALIMIFPELRKYIFSSENFEISHQYRYVLGMTAALMTGWTVLLIWGSLKPFERKGLLIITVFPVISGIVIAQVYAVFSRYIELTKLIPIWIHLIFISSFFIYAYFKSKQ